MFSLRFACMVATTKIQSSAPCCGAVDKADTVRLVAVLL